MPDWEVRASTDLPIVDRDEWDGDEAARNILDLYSDEDGEVDAEQAARGFLLFNTDEDGSALAHYRFPFADVVDGELSAITSGIVAADTYLEQGPAEGETLGEMEEIIAEYRRRSDDLNDPDETDADLYVIPKDLDPPTEKREDTPAPEFKREGVDSTNFVNNDLGKTEKDLPYETFGGVGTGQTKRVDTESRVVAGYYTSWETIDADNERFVQGAFSRSIQEDGPNAENQRIKHLYQHDIRGVVGKPRVLKEDEFGLYFETEIVGTALGNDVLRMYDADLFEHSVGFMRLDEVRQDDGVVEIVEAQLMEGSSVTWGANPNTPFTGFKSVTEFAEHLAEKAKSLRELLESNPETLDSEQIALGLRQLESSLHVLDEKREEAKQREDEEGIEFPLSLFDEKEKERIDLSDTGSFF